VATPLRGSELQRDTEAYPARDNAQCRNLTIPNELTPTTNPVAVEGIPDLCERQGCRVTAQCLYCTVPFSRNARQPGRVRHIHDSSTSSGCIQPLCITKHLSSSRYRENVTRHHPSARNVDEGLSPDASLQPEARASPRPVTGVPQTCPETFEWVWRRCSAHPAAVPAPPHPVSRKGRLSRSCRSSYEHVSLASCSNNQQFTCSNEDERSFRICSNNVCEYGTQHR
jgi:hypothetical protein